MARSSSFSRRQAVPLQTFTSFTTYSFILLLSLLCGPSLAAHSPHPAPPPVVHDVVAPGVAAAADNHNHNHHYYNTNQHRRDNDDTAPSAPYTPLVTQAPTAVPDDQALKDQGFRQETYYTCVTASTGKEHCGWHTPVLKQAKQGSAAKAAVPGRATNTGIVVAVVVGFACVFAVGMM